MIAQREPLLSPAIAAAVAQHHERLDGTGYPRGLEGEAIGKLARVLMPVEVALATLEHDREQPGLQLSLILRLNHRSFDAGLAREALWHVRQIAYDAQHRWPELDQGPARPAAPSAAGDWVARARTSASPGT